VIFYCIRFEVSMANNYTNIYLHDSDVRTEPIVASEIISDFIIMLKSH